MTKLLTFLAFILFVTTSSSSAEENSEELLRHVAAGLTEFMDELPDMPRIRGYASNKSTFSSAHLTIGMYQTKWRFHSELNETNVFAFGTSPSTATVPGPTIEALQGVETVVTWENHLPDKHILPWDETLMVAKPNKGLGVPTVVHLHGGIHEPTSDGHPTAWFTPDFRETGPAWKSPKYRYLNVQHPGNLWYHDHALGLTRVNLLSGLLGAYVVRNRAVEEPLRLPSGRKYDRHLVIFDRSFNRDGSLFINSTGNNPSIHPQWQPEYFGDAIVVNGKAWPYMKVTRRKYRFRIINASNARFYNFSLTNGLTFTVIGSDSAYLPSPVKVTSFLLSPSEIADVIIDFAKSSEHSAILKNDAPYPYPSGDAVDLLTGNVMKFTISPRGPSGGDPTRVPQKLLEYTNQQKTRSKRKERYITMYEYVTDEDEPTHLYLNGLSFDKPVTETPKQGTDEIWHVINLTDDNHPLHVHLALMQGLVRRVIVRQDAFKACMTKENDAVKCKVSEHAVGKVQRFPAEERGWKNVLKIDPGHVVTILVRFSLLDSQSRHQQHRHDRHGNLSSGYPFDATGHPGYVYHCHILDHEDNEMMRPFYVDRG